MAPKTKEQKARERTQEKIIERWGKDLILKDTRELCAGCQNKAGAFTADEGTPGNCVWSLLPVSIDGSPCIYHKAAA